MAGSYVLPQVRVFQEFLRAPNAVTQSLNAFLIGPNYQLIRYSDKDARDFCTSKVFSAGKSTILEWASGYAGSKPDKSQCSVTMADGYVQLGSVTGSPVCLDSNGSKGTKFEFQLSNGKSLVGTDPDELEFDVSVKPGDYLAYVDEGTTNYTKIRSISVGTPNEGEVIAVIKKKDGGDASGIFTVDASTYAGEKSARINLHLDEGTKKLSWTSNVSGLSGTTATAVAVGTEVELTKGGPTVVVAALTSGDYVLTLTLKEPYARDTVTVADLVPATASFTFVRHFDAADVVEDDIDIDDDHVTVSTSARVDIGLSTPFTVLTGTAYLNQRNLRTDHADTVYMLGSDRDIVRELGAIDKDNPLAYGAHVMLLNSANKRIRYIGVASDDYDGYATALDRASVTTDVYAFCPLTEDGDIIDAIVADCKRLSDPEEKSWRIAIFSKPTAESEDVTPAVLGVPETCKVVGKTLTCYSGKTSTVSSAAQFTDTVRVGDVVTVITAAGVGVESKVASVTSNAVLGLEDTIPGADSANCRFSILHTLGRAEYVEAIASTSSAFRDRRAYNVFPNSLRASDGSYVTGIYAAAAVCALACSVLPQQPITNVEVKGFSDIPDVYSKFSRDELNKIAAGGTLIVMQDKVGGQIYVRHQISTAYADGDINSTELSLVKNLDSISYYFAGRFAPYIGRYNITDDLLAELNTILVDGLAFLETTSEADRLIGPQVIAEGTEVRSLYRDPNEKDKAYADVALNLPEPFNNFDLHLQVI